MRKAGRVSTALRRATATGLLALVGALTGAAVGFALGGLAGSLGGLPRGRLLSDAPDEGFDQLDLALLVSFAFWVVGAVTAAWLRQRRRAGLPVRGPLAALLLAVLGGSTTLIGSGTADWYVPLVALGAPPIVLGTLSASAPRTANSNGD
jgi:hypothetical protein